MTLSTRSINQLRQNARSVVRELGLLNDAYAQIDVTLAERHLLIELDSPLPIAARTIAERLLLDKSTVSRLISRAVKKGYVKRAVNEKDRREQLLHLTKKGKETLDAFEAIAFQQTKNALRALEGTEVEAVYRGVALYSKGLARSRLKNSLPALPCQIESLPEISKELLRLGYTLGMIEKSEEEALYAIFQEVVETGAQFPYENSSYEEFQQQFLTPDGSVYVCRSLAGELLGGFYLRANFSGRSNHIANAAYMIKSGFRGKGIGSLLVKASLHLAKEQGFRAMQFNMVLSQNSAAVKLYERIGFDTVGSIPEAVRNPDGSYQEGYVMHRLLKDL